MRRPGRRAHENRRMKRQRYGYDDNAALTSEFFASAPTRPAQETPAARPRSKGKFAQVTVDRYVVRPFRGKNAEALGRFPTLAKAKEFAQGLPAWGPHDKWKKWSYAQEDGVEHVEYISDNFIIVVE